MSLGQRVGWDGSVLVLNVTSSKQGRRVYFGETIVGR